MCFLGPTHFSKLYLDPNYGTYETVFPDKILGPNSHPGEIDPYIYICDPGHFSDNFSKPEYSTSKFS